jgi:hypothetical protein
MQQFKEKFTNSNYHNTFTNVQRCFRSKDLDEVGDKTHLLMFDMIGLFSFREWTVSKTINFFIEFLNRLGLQPDTVTIHPDKIDSWSHYYKDYTFKIEPDEDCLWSDGNIGGYSTEFYINGIEIGNIVNTLGTCIDVGFGLERLLLVSNSIKPLSRLSVLEKTCMELIDNGIQIGDYKESYILKKLIILSIKNGSNIKHDFFQDQKKKMIMNYNNYLRTKKKPKFQDKDASYWKNTFGIDEDDLDFYKNLSNNFII